MKSALKYLFAGGCFFGCSSLALAQFDPDKLNFGVTAGLGLTNLVTKEDGQKPPGETYSPGLGLRLGGFARYRFNESWGVQPGLELTTVSSTAKFQGDKTHTSVVGLAVPVTYALPVGDKAVIFNAGPLFRLNLSGKLKSDGFSQKLEFGGATADYRRLTPGLQLGVAYRIPVPRLFRSRASAHGGEDREVAYIITGIDGSLLRNRVQKQKPELHVQRRIMEHRPAFFLEFRHQQARQSRV